MIGLTTLMLSATLLTLPADARSTAPPDLTIAAVRQGVVDMQQSIDLYTGHLGFAMLMDSRDEGFVVLDNNGVMLVLTAATSPAKIADGQAFCSLNMHVADLEATAASLAEAGMTRVDESIHTAAVGRYVRFNDPSGNRVHVMELSDETRRPDSPRVYNVGFSITDMKQAESFYTDTLGFNVLTRDYYPPVLPFEPRGATYFVLKDNAATRPAGYRYGTGAWTGLAIECRNIDETMRALAERGVTFIDDAPRTTGPVRCAAFTDPSGIVHELIEHIQPGDADDTADAATIEDLAWIAGTWRAEGNGQVLEEHWLPPLGNCMTGTFRWTRNGSAWLYEFMTFEQTEDGIVFYLRHFGPAFIGWEEKNEPLAYPLLSVRRGEAIFEDRNAGEDHPTRFVFTLRDERTLSIKLIDARGPGEPEEDEFVFTRYDRSLAR